MTETVEFAAKRVGGGQQGRFADPIQPTAPPTEITFPHITTNTLTKVAGSGVPAGGK